MMILGLLGMAFFGDAQKSGLAIQILKILFIRLGGGGILSLVVQAARWMLRNSE
jgi:hypothetical protein